MLSALLGPLPRGPQWLHLHGFATPPWRTGRGAFVGAKEGPSKIPKTQNRRLTFLKRFDGGTDPTPRAFCCRLSLRSSPGVVFLLPPTVSREVLERSVMHEQSLLDKAWRLPTASAFGPSRGLPVEPVIMRAGKHREHSSFFRQVSRYRE